MFWRINIWFYLSVSWSHRCFGLFGVTVIPADHHSHNSLAWKHHLSLHVWGSGIRSLLSFWRLPPTVCNCKDKQTEVLWPCEPERRLWGEKEGVVMPQTGQVRWIIFVLSFVTMQEVTATSRHYVDRLFDPDPQNVLQGVMWVCNHVSVLCVTVHCVHF